MLNMSINNITQVKAYENIVNNDQYLEIKYKDLDNNENSLLFSPTHNQFNYDTNDTEYNINFGILVPLIYDILDYTDARNEFYKIIYRFSLEVTKRGYYFTEMIDRGTGTKISVNYNKLASSIHIGGKSLFKSVSMTNDEYFALDDNNNKVLLDSSSVQLYKALQFNTGNIICDLQKKFEMSIIQVPNVRFIRDYNAKIKYPSILIRVDTPTTDDFDDMISKANEYSDIFFNILIYNTLDSLNSDVKDKVREASDLHNVHIYLTIDTDNMNTPYDSVLSGIDDIYNEFNSNIDGILLDNIKVLDDDADDDLKNQWTAYHIGIKKYAHNRVLDNGDILRYYIISRHSSNITKYYQVSNYNNPGDTYIGYINDVPDTASQLGDLFYKDYRHIIIQNQDLANAAPDLVNTLYKYSNNIYVNSTDDFSHPDMDNVDQLCQYLSVENDKSTPIQVRQIK